jgi:hypothetical protein
MKPKSFSDLTSFPSKGVEWRMPLGNSCQSGRWNSENTSRIRAKFSMRHTDNCTVNLVFILSSLLDCSEVHSPLPKCNVSQCGLFSAEAQYVRSFTTTHRLSHYTSALFSFQLTEYLFSKGSHLVLNFITLNQEDLGGEAGRVWKQEIQTKNWQRNLKWRDNSEDAGVLGTTLVWILELAGPKLWPDFRQLAVQHNGGNV